MGKLTCSYTFMCLKLSICLTSGNNCAPLFIQPAHKKKRLSSGENAIIVIMAASQTLMANTNDLAADQNAHMDG